jgi:hypothetical protein
MTVYINVNTSPFTISNNSYDYIFLTNSANTLKLPVLDLQLTPIIFANYSSVIITINDNDNNLVYSLPVMNSVELFPNKVLNIWSVLNATNTVPILTGFLLTNGLNNMAANLNFGGFNGVDLATPLNPTDAVNKEYVDESISDLTGFLLTNGGNSMTGNLNFGNNRGINLSNPINPQDAVTKSYADTASFDTWKTVGNAGLTSGFLGTVDNNNFSLLGNNSVIGTIGSTVSNGFPGININTNNYLTAGPQVGLPDTATICIKQGAQVSNSSPGSYWGMKFFNNSTNDGAYMGIANVSGTPGLGMFIETAGGIYTRIVDMITNLLNIYTPLSMNSHSITNLANPVNPQDAVTKIYEDNKYSTTIGSLAGSNPAGTYTITFTSPANSTIRLNLNVYLSTGGNWGNNTIVSTSMGNNGSFFGYGNSAISPPTDGTVGLGITAISTSSMTFITTFYNTANGFSLFCLN